MSYRYVARLGLFTALLAVVAACNNGAPPPDSFAVSFDGAKDSNAAAQLAHGERLTWVLGCQGCHGKGMTGNQWDDDPAGYGVMWATNLTRAVPTMNDAQLLAVLQRGQHPTRAELWLMPSQLFQHLSAADIKALVLYLRTLKPQGDVSPPPVLGPKARSEIAAGKYRPAASMVSTYRTVLPADAGPEHALGRYITAVTCAECHGIKLEGDAAGTPDLIVAGAYTRPEFELMLTKGIALHGRKIDPLMSQVARSRFSKLTPHERDAIYAYLIARAAKPQ